MQKLPMIIWCAVAMVAPSGICQAQVYYYAPASTVYSVPVGGAVTVGTVGSGLVASAPVYSYSSLPAYSVTGYGLPAYTTSNYYVGQGLVASAPLQTVVASPGLSIAASPTYTYSAVPNVTVSAAPVLSIPAYSYTTTNRFLSRGLLPAASPGVVTYGAAPAYYQAAPVTYGYYYRW